MAKRFNNHLKVLEQNDSNSMENSSEVQQTNNDKVVMHVSRSERLVNYKPCVGNVAYNTCIVENKPSGSRKTTNVIKVQVEMLKNSTKNATTKYA